MSDLSKRPRKTDPDYDPVRGVTNFIQKNYRHVNPPSANRQYRIILEYAGVTKFEPSEGADMEKFNETLNKTIRDICQNIQENWKKFAAWFDTEYGEGSSPI